MALIAALEQLKEPCEIDLCSDSQYVINGLQKGWARASARGLEKSGQVPCLEQRPLGPPAGPERGAHHSLQLDQGPCGPSENERCDRLAVEQSKRFGGRQA